MGTITVQGYCDPAFTKVQQTFINNFEKKRETGAAVSIVMEGKTVVDIWAGYSDFWKNRPWQQNTLANIYSSTKGITAICALRLIDQGRLDPDKTVAAYWPQFGKNGKEKITVRMLLNHTAGLSGIKKRLPAKSLYEWNTMIRALENQEPWWPPGEKHGYHAVSFGWLVGQVIRNITGMSVGEYLKEEITGPLGLDLHIGLAETEHHRSATMVMLRIPSIHQDAIRFSSALVKHPAGLTACAFTNPWSIATGVNTRQWRKAELPAANGQSSARALATLYGALANGGSRNGYLLLSPETLELCSRETVSGTDHVLQLPTRFSLGFMLNQDNPSGSMGPGQKVFGHPGAGGSLGFADPEARLGFGYVMNKMDTYILIDPRAKALIDAAYTCL